MNANIKKAFKDFIQEVMYFAVSVSSVSGTDAVRDLGEKAATLMKQLDKDETILD